MMTAATRTVLGAGVLAGAGCSTVLGIESDRYVSANVDVDAATETGRDGGTRGGGDASRDGASGPEVDAAAAGKWDCVSQPPEQLDPGFRVSVTVTVMDAVQPSTSAGAVDGGSDLDTIKGAWLSGASVRACAVRDTNCQSPLETAVTNDAGQAVFSLTGDFAGFFDVRRSDLVPSTLYPGNLLAGQPAASFPAYGISPDAFQSLAKSTAHVDAILSTDAGLGHVLITIYDCQDHQAPDVSVAYRSLGSRGVPFYFNGGLPDPMATETDGYGLAGAINVPVGTLMAKATLADGTAIGTASLDVRPGGLTFAWIRARSH